MDHRACSGGRRAAGDDDAMGSRNSRSSPRLHVATTGAQGGTPLLLPLPLSLSWLDAPLPLSRGNPTTPNCSIAARKWPPLHATTRRPVTAL